MKMTEGNFTKSQFSRWLLYPLGIIPIALISFILLWLCFSLITTFAESTKRLKLRLQWKRVLQKQFGL